MEYRNNYLIGKQSVIFSIAVYIKKHFIKLVLHY